MGKIHEALHKTATAQPEANQYNKAAVASSDALHEPPKDEPPISYISPEPSQKKPFKARSPVLPISNWDQRIQLAINSSSSIAESFRKLRTKILHPDKGTPPRTLLITSAVPSEGKGFVAANLGVSVAQSADTKCTLVDCDLRRPTIASLFAANPSARGLSNYLKGEIDWGDAMLATAQENLQLMPSGPPPESPSELIDSSRMINLMENFRRETAELFILDSPPLHAASETAVLAQLADKILIVVRWGTSGREQVSNLIDTIGREKIIGIVFNAFEQNALDNMFEKKGY